MKACKKHEMTPPSTAGDRGEPTHGIIVTLDNPATGFRSEIPFSILGVARSRVLARWRQGRHGDGQDNRAGRRREEARYDRRIRRYVPRGAEHPLPGALQRAALLLATE